MARIVIHAGMPKTGSTSVQRWIIDNAARLRAQHGIEVLVATSGTARNPTDEVRLEPYESGDVNSGRIVKEWRVRDGSTDVAHRFVDDLSRFAGCSPTVLVTAEALSQVFWRVDEPFLSGFDELTRDHEVRVAYYVRPQPTALEAGWREGGYKEPRYRPSEWVLEQSKRGLHYLPTLESTRELAPDLEFVVRPFVPELLDGGSPVEDFVRRFLSLDEACPEVHVNPGLPLELVNLLRCAPEGAFWRREGVEQYPERYPRWKLNELFDGLEVPESPEIRRSRLVLHQHCHEVFEPENRKLIRDLEWRLDAFVPPTEEREGRWRLEELDSLWVPDASVAERGLLFHALHAALD